MRNALNIIILSFLILACNDKPKSNTQLEIKDSLTVDTSQVKPKIFNDIIYQNENIKIIGDTAVLKNKIMYASIKFEPYISFDDFKVPTIVNYNKKDIDLNSHKGAREFRTVLQNGYKSDSSNFAGHYTFIQWGCGTSCQTSAIIDRQTGYIYSGPAAEFDYEYYMDSRMIITNPPDSAGFYDDCFYCKPKIYVFNEQTKKFDELKPKYK
jgi:hypothetical protein